MIMFIAATCIPFICVDSYASKTIASYLQLRFFVLFYEVHTTSTA